MTKNNSISLRSSKKQVRIVEEISESIVVSSSSASHRTERVATNSFYGCYFRTTAAKVVPGSS